MSLTGNLEDLPLLDILQIVSFSKKTGYLSIKTENGEAAIVFADGYVVSSFAPDSPPVDPRMKALPVDKREKVIRGRIEMALEQLIRLRFGEFNFSLTDAAPTQVGERDIKDEMLQHGINAQELLLDLARGMDEDRRDSTAALEASFAQPSDDELAAAEASANAAATQAALESEAWEKTQPHIPVPEIESIDLTEEPAAPAAPTPAPVAAAPAAPEAPPAAAAAPEEIKTVLVVDDEREVRRALVEAFTASGYEVVDAEDVDVGVKKAGVLGKADKAFVLVVDLGMPTSGGSSFQGGFEVVKRLWKMNLNPPVLMMTDTLGGAIQTRAKQMGIKSFVFKPGLSKLDPDQFEADLKAFATKIDRDVLPRLARGGAPDRPLPAGGKAAAPPVAAPKAAAAPQSKAAPSPDVMSKEFLALQKHLDELRSTADASQVAQVVMKVAKEFFERGILFLVKNEEVRGLGGFGKGPGEQTLTLVTREVVIPLAEPSVFLEVVDSRKAFVGPLPDAKWTSYLLGRIGRHKAEGAVIMPLLTHRETIALLYGDNPETGKAFGRLEALQVFINQAGIALENAFLQKKVYAMQAQG